MWVPKLLFGVSGQLISLGMIAFLLDELLTSPHTRSVFQDDLPAYPWILSPYLAVDLIGYFVRSDPVSTAFTLLAALVSTAIGFYLPYPYLLDDGNSAGKSMAAGLVPLLQWMVLGAIAVLGLICALLRKRLKPSGKSTSGA